MYVCMHACKYICVCKSVGTYMPIVYVNIDIYVCIYIYIGNGRFYYSHKHTSGMQNTHKVQNYKIVLVCQVFFKINSKRSFSTDLGLG